LFIATPTLLYCINDDIGDDDDNDDDGDGDDGRMSIINDKPYCNCYFRI